MPVQYTSAISERPVEDAISDEEVFVFPTTLGQQRFWLADQFQRGSSNMPLAQHLVGPLDIAAMRAAVAEVVRRHESLRTIFQEINGQPMQVITPPFEVSLPLVDLTFLPYPERESAAAQAIQTDAAIPLDLGRGPLIRCQLLKLSDTEHILTTTMHHIICDGWSNGVYLREIAAIYDGIVRGVPAQLEELPLQYADYAYWQDEWLKSGSDRIAVEFWKKQLGSPVRAIEIPTDRPRKASGKSPGDIETLLIPADLTERLRQYCQREGCTPYALYMAVFQILLYRYSGRETFLIGSPAACRTQPELESLIGLFANPVLTRADFSGAPAFKTVVDRVRSWTLDTWDYQILPFERLITELDLEDVREGTSLLRIYFIYQKAFMEPQQAGELTLTPIRSVSAGAMFDLMLGIVERAEGPRLQMEYNTDLFDRSRIQRILRQFCMVLRAGLESPQIPVDSVTIADQGDTKIHQTNREPGGDVAPTAPHLMGDIESTERGSRARGNRIAPRSRIEAQLFPIWVQVLGFAEFGVRDSFLELGGSSLQAFSLITAINKEFRTSFSGPTLFYALTIEAQARLIEETVARRTQNLVVPLQLGSASEPPFFMVHSYHLYAALDGNLRKEQPFYGIQEFAVEDQVVSWSLEDMMSRYVAAIRSVQPQGPYIIGGFCSAALPAFEVARQLREAGESVPLLVVIESLGGRQNTNAGTRLDRIRRAMDLTRVKWRFHSREVGTMSFARKVRHVANMARRKSRNMLTNAEIGAWRRLCRICVQQGWKLPAPLRRKLVSGIRIVTLEAVRQYSPKPYAGDIQVFLAKESTFGVEDQRQYETPWRGLTSGNVRITWLPGNHDTAFVGSNLAVFASHLNSAIAAAAVAEQQSAF